MTDCYSGKNIAILIPCYNEELTIGKVVDDFKREFPSAVIYVVDNCSNDQTAPVADNHGAVVIKEPRQGKGFVIEKMFRQIRADYYIMVDGDDTYPAEYAHKLLAPVISGEADMAVGTRLSEYSDNAFRPLHVFGNNLVRLLVNWMGHSNLADIMSGYRAFNNDVTDCIPVISSGFEIETEMTIQMLYYRRKIVEVEVPYRQRPKGSESKLNTIRDGMKVLWRIFTLFRSFKPLTFFGIWGLIFFISGLTAGFFPIHDYFTDPNHYVHHVPLAILASGLMILSGGSIFLGILLHAINWRLMEMHNVLTRNRFR